MYCIISILSFIIFISIMRFQIWGTRYEISFLALLCPAISLLLNISLKDNYKKYVIGAIYGIALLSLMNQFNYHINIIKDIKSKNEGYFKSNYVLLNTYSKICDIINREGFQNIGLEITENTYEYPLYEMINDFNKIEHVNVTNSSSIYYNEEFKPEIVISNVSDKEIMIYNKNTYKKMEQIDEYCIYYKIKEINY